MLDVVFDPMRFFRLIDERSCWKALSALITIQVVGVTTLLTKMALYVPAEERSAILVAFAIGLGLAAVIKTTVGFGLACTFFWALTWFTKNRLLLSRSVGMVCYSLIPGQVATLAVRVLLIILSPASTPLSAITNATSLAAIVHNAPGYMTLLDPFLMWAVGLLTLAHQEVTNRRYSIWISLAVSAVPLLLTRLG